jgi:hypothetical protein
VLDSLAGTQALRVIVAPRRGAVSKLLREDCGYAWEIIGHDLVVMTLEHVEMVPEELQSVGEAMKELQEVHRRYSGSD